MNTATLGTLQLQVVFLTVRTARAQVREKTCQGLSIAWTWALRHSTFWLKSSNMSTYPWTCLSAVLVVIIALHQCYAGGLRQCYCTLEQSRQFVSHECADFKFGWELRDHIWMWKLFMSLHASHETWMSKLKTCTRSCGLHMGQYNVTETISTETVSNDSLTPVWWCWVLVYWISMLTCHRSAIHAKCTTWIPNLGQSTTFLELKFDESFRRSQLSKKRWVLATGAEEWLRKKTWRRSLKRQYFSSKSITFLHRKHINPQKKYISTHIVFFCGKRQIEGISLLL